MADDDLLSGYDEGSAAKGRGRGKRRRWPWFLVGIALGVVGTIFVPDLIAPYLPAALRRASLQVTGPVLAKRMEDQNLLLTVDTREGALLATFRERVAEIGLLVDQGDTVTLGLKEYRPLVNDPVLESVKKGVPGSPRGRPLSGGPGAGAAQAGSTALGRPLLPESVEPMPGGSGRSSPTGLPATGPDSGSGTEPTGPGRG